jgi:very-short-patch-repair endonuclease
MTSSAEFLLEQQLLQDDIPFQREYRFAKPRRWRADFKLGDRFSGRTIWRPLLVEIDGGGFIGGRHGRGVGIERDAEKQSAAAILGYRVIRVTPRQVEDGRALSWIRQALGMEESDAA